MERLYTVGVYGFTAETFFAALERDGIDLLLDIRRRRGVRGSEYAFANAARLQEALDERSIAYRHVLDLAPENETREIQERQDRASGTARRQRTALGPAFITDFTQRTLLPFDWDALRSDLTEYRRPALLCVERVPEACHRSLVAQRLVQGTDVPVMDIVP